MFCTIDVPSSCRPIEQVVTIGDTKDSFSTTYITCNRTSIFIEMNVINDFQCNCRRDERLGTSIGFERADITDNNTFKNSAFTSCNDIDIHILNIIELNMMKHWISEEKKKHKTFYFVFFVVWNQIIFWKIHYAQTIFLYTSQAQRIERIVEKKCFIVYSVWSVI